MGLNWLSALVPLSGITQKLLVFGKGGKLKELNLCDSFFRSELFLPSLHDALHKLQQCHGSTPVFLQWRRTLKRLGNFQCLYIKTRFQRSRCWRNILESTFYPCWTYVALVRGSDWIAKHNNHAYNRTKYNAPQYVLTLRSKDIQYAHCPARWNSFGLIFCESLLQMCLSWRFQHTASKVEDALLWHTAHQILRKEVAAIWPQRSSAAAFWVRQAKSDEHVSSLHAENM